MPKIQYLVLRVHDIETAKRFYGIIGLVFRGEKHGKEEFHYSTVIDGMVLEFYPLRPGQSPSLVQFGFEFQGEVGDIMTVCERLGREGFCVLNPPRLTSQGYTAKVVDPFGNKIELIQNDGVLFSDLGDCLWNTCITDPSWKKFIK